MITKPKILVIEDNLINVKVVVLLLQDLGYHNIEVAYNGEQGLEAFDKTIHLVVLDIGLPGIDGVEVARRIRQQSAVPIIAYTAFDPPKNNQWQLAGITDYVIKPITSAILGAVITKYLPLKKS